MRKSLDKLFPCKSILILVVAIGLASCGGEDDESESESESSARSGEPPAANPPAEPENSAPTLSGKPPSQILVGDAVDFTPTAADADGDILTFSVQNLPAWASFDKQTGRITGTPDEADVGSYAGIRITVTDGAASTTSPAFTIAVVGTATGTAMLSWTPPTQKTDGSPVTLAGYRVYWGSSSRDYSHFEQVGANVADYVVSDLTPATWYFAVTALDSNGVESAYSNEAVKVVQ